MKESLRDAAESYLKENISNTLVCISGVSFVTGYPTGGYVVFGTSAPPTILWDKYSISQKIKDSMEYIKMLEESKIRLENIISG